ncbi:hypothetical protein GCM10009582_07710 [Arthrobacter flavus]
MEASAGFGVVAVPMGNQNQFNAPRASERRQVSLIQRTGIHDDNRAFPRHPRCSTGYLTHHVTRRGCNEIRVRAFQAHRSRIGGKQIPSEVAAGNRAWRWEVNHASTLASPVLVPAPGRIKCAA